MPATPPVQMKEKQRRNWLLVPALVVAALLLFGGIALFQAQSVSKPQPQAQATAMLPLIQAQPNDTAIPSIVAQPDTTATEEAIAGATSTPLMPVSDPGQATSISQSTIKIVSSLPRTGLSKRQTDDIVAGYLMVLEESNNKAGNFTIIYEDLDDSASQAGRWDPNSEMSNAVKSANDPDVMVYLGPFNSGAAAISIPILNEAGLAMISPSNTAPELTKPGFDDQTYNSLYTSGPKNYFRVSTSDDVQGAAAANWATELGFTNAYILDDQKVYGRAVASTFEKQFKVNGGTVQAHEGIDYHLEDFKFLMNKVLDSRADLVYFGGLVDTGGPQLLKDLRSVAPNTAFMGPDGIYSVAFIDAAGADIAEGVYATGYYSMDIADFGTEGKAFLEKFKTKYGRDADPYAIYGYESMKVALNAIERAGKKDRAAILDAIRNTRDYQGALGTWSFDENGDISLDAVPAFKVESGDYVFQKYIKGGR
ncbi:MAG TPA: branched-chain amino acid ABC transporter substrate-binding protein [Chloroflexia bacterium]|jgi:branched-chain amino acid transport system substrate-binding protein